MGRFYALLLRETLGVFRQWWETSAFWTGLAALVLAVWVPVVNRLARGLQLSGWLAILPIVAVLLVALSWANYNRFRRLEDQLDRQKTRKERQVTVDHLAECRAQACDLIARRVRSDADYTTWQLEANEWAERVGGTLEAEFTRALRMKFDYVGVHAVQPIAGAYNDAHLHGMAILDNKIRVLANVIGDGIAQP